MKTGSEHRVPLSAGALAVLERAREIENGSGLIFPSFKGLELRSPQVAGAFRDLGIPSTVHGLRSSFRDWAAETGVDRTVAEAALAHKVGGVEGAYFRSDLFERRRQVMEDWSAYLAGRRAGTGT
jgi:integrase